MNRREVKRTLLRDVRPDRSRRQGAPGVPQTQRPQRFGGAATVSPLPLVTRRRDVVLFAHTCLIGPQSSCHIRTSEGDTQVVLFDRSGHLYGREATSRGGKLGDAHPLALGETFDFSDVRVTIKAYQDHDSAGSR